MNKYRITHELEAADAITAATSTSNATIKRIEDITQPNPPQGAANPVAAPKTASTGPASSSSPVAIPATPRPVADIIADRQKAEFEKQKAVLAPVAPPPAS